jgi:hypothetical protein
MSKPRRTIAERFQETVESMGILDPLLHTPRAKAPPRKRSGRPKGSVVIGRDELLGAYWAEAREPEAPMRDHAASPSKDRVAGRLGRAVPTLNSALRAHGLDWENMPKE